MKCASCGTGLPDDAVFCLRCGARQGSVAAAGAEAALEVRVQLGEVPYAIVLTDIWLFVMVNKAVSEVRATARPTNNQGQYGAPLQGALLNPRPGVLEPLVKLGDLVRWSFDFAEISVEVRAVDATFAGTTTVPMHARDVRPLAVAKR